MMNKKNNNLIILTASLPYINNNLHLGHIYSTFLPADIQKRSLQITSKEVFFVSGNDVFGYKIYLKSIFENKDVEEIKNTFKKEHESVLKYFNISFDNFKSTDEKVHSVKVNELTKQLIQEKTIYKTYETFLFCKNHNIYIIDDAREKDKCLYCLKDDLGENIQKIKHSVLKLKIKKEKFDEYIKHLSLNKVAKNEINKIITDISNFNFSEKTISRPFNYGVEIDREIGVKGVYYVWYEAIISYMSFSEWHNSSEIKQYMGKDNVFFHTVLLSNIYKKKPNSLFSGSYLLYKGDKFSKTKNIGIFCKEMIEKKIPSDGLRFALSFLSRERDINISVKEIENIINNILISKILNTFQRYINLLHKKNIIVKKDNIKIEDNYLFLEKIILFFKYINECKFSSSVQVLIFFSEEINKFIDEKKIWEKTNNIFKDLSQIYFSLSCLSKILSIYCVELKLEDLFFEQNFSFRNIDNEQGIFKDIYCNMKKVLKFEEKILIMKKIIN